jgi:hypothetical protein
MSELGQSRWFRGTGDRSVQPPTPVDVIASANIRNVPMTDISCVGRGHRSVVSIQEWGFGPVTHGKGGCEVAAANRCVGECCRRKSRLEEGLRGLPFGRRLAHRWLWPNFRRSIFPMPGVNCGTWMAASRVGMNGRPPRPVPSRFDRTIPAKPLGLRNCHLDNFQALEDGCTVATHDRLWPIRVRRSPRPAAPWR